MAIVEMRKLTLLGLVAEKDRLMRELSFCRCLEVAEAPEYEGTAPFEQRKEDAQAGVTRVKNAIDGFAELRKEAKNLNGYAKREVAALEKAIKKEGSDSAHQTNALIYADSEDKKALTVYNPPKLAKFPIAEVFSFERFDGIGDNLAELNSIMDGLEAAQNRLSAIRSEMVSLTTLRSQLLPYRDMTMPFDALAGTRNTAWYVGIISVYAYDKLAAAVSGNDLVTMFKLSSYGTNVVFGILYHRSESEFVTVAVQDFDISVCTFDGDKTAAQRISEINRKLKSLGDEVRQISETYAEKNDDLEKLKHLYDYYVLELRKLESAEKCRTTDKVFLLTGWVPERKVNRVLNALNDSGAVVAYEISLPEADEEPPTATDNVGLVSAFDGITNMYGAPSYRESDPNMFVAIFYFLFFGIMLGDAGYGLVLTIGCLVLMHLRKPTRKKSKMLLMLTMCGISTVLWGATLGSWFAIDDAGFLTKISWFNPMKEPLKMFVLSLALGAIQLSVGFLLGAITNWRNGTTTGLKLGGFCSSVAWTVIMIAFFFVLPMLKQMLGMQGELSKAQQTLVSIGKYIALVGVGLLVVGGVMGKKNPLKMLTGIFGNFYGALSVLSDILSYTRIFGLGLTSGVIGYVLNVLAGLLIQLLPGVGYVFAIVILVGGHAFNLAINTLGAYVHNSRLQFIEFFGHFYDGSGYQFKPLGEEMQYTYIEEKTAA